MQYPKITSKYYSWVTWKG